MERLIGFLIICAGVYYGAIWIWENVIPPLLSFLGTVLVYGGLAAVSIFGIFLIFRMFKKIKANNDLKKYQIEKKYRNMTTYEAVKDIETLKKYIKYTGSTYGSIYKLIDTEIDINVLHYLLKHVDINSNSLICSAAKEGNLELVKILLSKGANIDAKDSDGDSALILASIMGHKNIVELLLDKGANIDTKDSDGDSAFLTIFYSNIWSKETAELLLERGAHIETRNSNNNTALIISAYKGYVPQVKFLLEKGANIEAQSEDRSTPLLKASSEGHVEVVKLLLEKGADIEAQDVNEHTALKFAINKGHTEIVDILLKSGAKLDTNDEELTEKIIVLLFGEKYNLFTAIKDNKIEIVSLLLDKDLDIETQDNDGNTALINASICGHKEIVELLLERGADIKAKMNDDATALINVSICGHKEIVELLLENGADIEAEMNNGATALNAASYNGNKEIVELLLDKGADIEAEMNDGATALINASEEGHEKTVELLLEKGADVEAQDNNKNTALIRTSNIGYKTEYIKIIKLLLEKGANLEIQDSNGNTSLIGASFYGNKEIVELLLDNGANIEAQNNENNTALIMASKNGKKEIVELLLDKGAFFDINNEKDTEGIVKLLFKETYNLIEASKNNTIDIVKFLLEKNINIEIEDEKANTALIVASEYGNKVIVELLLEKGANIEAQNSDSNTALIKASENGKKEIVELLLEKGANIEAQNSDDNTVLIKASENGHKKVVELLLEKGAELELQDNESAIALIIASENEHKDVVELLLKKNAHFDINNKNETKNIVKAIFNEPHDLISATENNNQNIVEFLLEKDINTEEQDSYGNTALNIASYNGYKEIVELLLEKGANIEAKNNNSETSLIIASEKAHKETVEVLLKHNADIEASDSNKFTSLLKASKNGNKETVNLLLKNGASIDAEDKNGINALILASINEHKNIVDLLSRNMNDPIITNVCNEINLSGYEKINFKLHNIVSNTLGIVLAYSTTYEEHFDWSNKEEEIKKKLGAKNIELLEQDSYYLVKVYNNTKEATLINQLKVESKKPELVNIIEHNYTTFIFFKDMPGITLSEWENQKQLIEDILKIPVDIELYDESHYLFDPDFSKEKLIVIIESNISVMPDILDIGGVYLKTIQKEGRVEYHFKNVKDIEKWYSSLDEIIDIIEKRVEIIQDGSIVILKELIEESIPVILDLKDSNRNYPELYDVITNGNNKTYYYTFLPEIDLNVWKERSKRKSFRTLFNQPNKVYKLEIYDKSNKELFDKEFCDGQLIALHELEQIPNKEELESLSIKTLENENIFWGYASGSKKYYSSINGISHMMVIGATGSGKSNFMNGIITSMLNSIDKIQKMYLIDLKSGIEFNRYKDLDSDKIDVFSRGTKPSKLLKALYEVEAEMYLREEYMVNNNITKIDKDPIFVIIDEFAQIDLMYAVGEEKFLKDEIFNVLLRIGTRARSANIKLIVQTQDPRSIPDDLKKHLMSRVLLKTGKDADKDFTLQNPDLLMEYGINHLNFDKGRFVFEDYNDGDTILTELQFPFLDPKDNMHLKFKEKSQIHTEDSKDKFKPYIKFIKEEYSHLENTKILNDGKDKSNNKDKQTISSEEKQDLELSRNHEPLIDDFDFDDLLNDDSLTNNTKKDEDKDEFNEINSDYLQALNLLEELKQKGVNSESNV